MILYTNWSRKRKANLYERLEKSKRSGGFISESKWELIILGCQNLHRNSNSICQSEVLVFPRLIAKLHACEGARW